MIDSIKARLDDLTKDVTFAAKEFVEYPDRYRANELQAAVEKVLAANDDLEELLTRWEP